MSLSKAPSKVLATALSDSFVVYSAKKFPGMIESTELSKAFAAQGIRIPVRHAGDHANGKANQGGQQNEGQHDDDDDEMDED